MTTGEVMESGVVVDRTVEDKSKFPGRSAANAGSVCEMVTKPDSNRAKALALPFRRTPFDMLQSSKGVFATGRRADLARINYCSSSRSVVWYENLLKGIRARSARNQASPLVIPASPSLVVRIGGLFINCFNGLLLRIPANPASRSHQS
jgi:hypothetical protein